MNMMSDMEEDAKGGAWTAPQPTIKEKKAQVKRILENDTELLNEIVLDIRKDKIDKIKGNG